MKEVIDELFNTYKEGNILVVTHGGSIGDLLRKLFSEKTITHKTEPVSGARYIEILECSITIVQRQKENFKLTKVNDVGHLSMPLI